MSVVLYLRGAPGTGKNAVARILERDLGWPRLWVHQLDGLFRIIPDHRVPTLTDDLMATVAAHLVANGRSFLFVRPSRSVASVARIKTLADAGGWDFIVARLTASRATLETRVTRRWHESPFRVTTKEALDEYLDARPEESYPGEHVIDTETLAPEQVASRVKELLPWPERNPKRPL